MRMCVCIGAETYLRGITNSSLQVKQNALKWFNDLKRNYYHIFKHLLEVRCLRVFFMPQSWVAENPEIGIFPHWTYNESEAAAKEC